MKLLHFFCLAAATVALAVGGRGAPTGASDAARPPLLLISLDGFRWDYSAQFPDETTHLRRLMREGVSARGLIPVYPSNTFPNHYSIVTGLYPTSHGMLNNTMFDPRLGEAFRYNRAGAAQDPRWWSGEPIWSTAIKQGRQSACLFWVGSEAPIDGIRPSRWRPFDARIPFAARLAELLEWLMLPIDQRPAIVTFYLEETNSVGHRFGVDSPELIATIKMLDAQVGELRAQLERIGITPDFVVVSDHGMTACSPDRVLLLDDYLDLETVQIDFEDSVAGLRPGPDTDVATILRALEGLPPTAKAYRAENLPAHFHIDPRHPRVPPVWIVPAEGWNVMRRSAFETVKHRFSKGQHGYDPALPSMHGILIAAGPSFKSTGEVVEAVENIHIYNLLCAALGLTPAPNEGDDRLIRSMLK